MASKRSLPGTTLRAVALASLFASSGCVTAAVWDECHSTAGAIALTPLTVAADAVLIVGYACLVGGAGCCGCDCSDVCIEFD
jgi:hypothetical protein